MRGAPGLRSQLLRAVASIAANIAEGSGKRSEVEFVRYLEIALASAREAENHILLARDTGALDAGVANALLRDAEEVGRILFGLQRAVSRRVDDGCDRSRGGV